MNQVDVVALPSQLRSDRIERGAVVVFDVLRATTSMATAIALGAKEIRVFDSLASASTAAAAFRGPKLLCGERDCVRPEGFDLGNSPVEFASASVGGQTLFMSTTNGTRAIVAARDARLCFAAALVNAAATAHHLAGLGMDVTMLCAGTKGEAAPDDLLGAGAVLHELPEATFAMTDAARTALDLYRQARGDVAGFLRETDGGRNVRAAGLDADIDFASQVNHFDRVVEISGDPPVARRVTSPRL